MGIGHGHEPQSVQRARSAGRESEYLARRSGIHRCPEPAWRWLSVSLADRGGMGICGARRKRGTVSGADGFDCVAFHELRASNTSGWTEATERMGHLRYFGKCFRVGGRLVQRYLLFGG